jgi:hypothetical protein
MEANALATANKREQIMEDLNNALVQIVEGRVQEAMRIEAAAGTDRLVFEERLSQRITDVKERGAARDLEIQATNDARVKSKLDAQARDWERFSDATLFALNEAGVGVRDILFHWAETVGVTVPDIATKLELAGVDINKLKDVYEFAFKHMGFAIDDFNDKVKTMAVPKGIAAPKAFTRSQAEQNLLAIVQQRARDRAAGLPDTWGLAVSQAAGAIQAIPVAPPLAGSAEAEAAEVKRIADAFAASIATGHSGGIVGGPPGSNQLIMAQAGETIIPAGRGGAGLTVSLVVNGDINGMDDFEEKVSSVIRDAVLGGGFSGVLARA